MRARFGLFLAFLLTVSLSASAQTSSFGESSADFVSFETPVPFEESDTGSFDPLTDSYEILQSDSHVTIVIQNAEQVFAGQPAQVLIIFHNTQGTSGGPFQISNVQLTFAFPSGWTFNSLSGNDFFQCGAPSNGQMQCSAQTFPPNQQEQLTFDATPNAAGSFFLTVSFTQQEFDPNTNDNSTQVEITVQNQVTISGRVWEDTNGNNVIDQGENGVANQCLYFDSNLNGTKDNGEPTEQTDSNGNYQFGPVAESSVRLYACDLQNSYVTLWPQVGYYDLTPNGQSLTNQNIALFRPGKILFRKIQDFNGNGVKDAGDTPIQSWTSRVKAGDGNTRFNLAGSETFFSSTTNATGYSSYTSLGPGQVIISETIPSQWTQSFPGNNTNSTVSITSGSVHTSTFLNWRQPFVQTIYMWDDPNQNSVADQGESGVSGIIFWIDLDGDGVQDQNEVSGTTGTGGSVALQPTSLGEHRICTASSTTRQYLSPSYSSGSWCRSVTFSSSTPAAEYYFYSIPIATSTISGIIWEDTNGNNIVDAGESRLENQCVYADSNSNGQQDNGEPTASSGADGTYSLGPFQNGSLRVYSCSSSTYTTLWPQAGYYDYTVAGSSFENQNYAYWRPASITFSKYQDFNGNGVQDNGDTPISSWRSTLTAGEGNTRFYLSNSTTTLSQNTNAQGISTYTNLGPGQVVVSENLPNGWTQSSPGGAGSSTLTVTSGAQLSTTFLNWQLPAIQTVFMWNDANQNSTADTGESGYSNILVWIDTDGDGILDSAEVSGTTGSDGSVQLQPSSLGEHRICTSSSTTLQYLSPSYTSGSWCQTSTFTSGSAATTYYFYARTLPTISGIFYEDTNGNNTIDSGESRLSGQCVYADSNLNGTQDQGEPTATSGSDGSYTIGPFSDGTIRLYGCSSSIYTTLWPQQGYYDFEYTLAGQAFTDQHYAYWRPASFTFKKHEDFNGNGVLDTGDTPIADWQATLTAGQGNTRFVVSDINITSIDLTTNATGIATYSGLGPGKVVVTENLPSGWTQSFPGVTSNSTVTVTSGARLSSTYLNWSVPSPTTVFLWNDANGNSAVDTGESGISGIRFWYDDNANSIEDAGETGGTTGADGSVSLQSTSLGERRICTSSSSSLVFYQPTVVSSASCRLITYQSRAPSTTMYYYAGFVTTSASAFVYVDNNGNGQRDSGESAAEGAQVTLERVEPNGNVTVSTSTMTTQSVVFTNLQPATYRMFTTIRVGWSRLVPANGEHLFTITNQLENVNLEFGEYQPGEISGWKFSDNDGDGTEDDGEGAVEGVTIDLARSSGDASGPYASLSTTTTSVPQNGTRAIYSYSTLQPGFYRVSELVQTGWTQTRPAAGNNEFAHPDLGANAYFIQLGSGQQVTGLTFGNRPPNPVIIEGYKYVDLDGDGVEDDGEPRLNDVTLQLKQGGNVIASAVTRDVDRNNDGEINPATERGWFVFDQPADGEYELSEVTPAGYSVTQPANNAYSVTVVTGQEITTPFIFGNGPNALDWGDLPDPREGLAADCPRGDPLNCYRTLAGVGGAAHILLPDAVRLGQRVDAEGDGQPNAAALGDDDNISSQGAEDDEDGLISFSVDGEGKISMTVDVSGAGFLDVYADIDDDGVLNDGVLAGEPLESIFLAEPVTDGINVIETAVGRVAAYADIKYIRMRISTVGGLGAAGIAINGEVEDYRVYVRRPQTIDAATDTGDATPGDGVCADANGNCSLRAAIQEANASGRALRLVFASGTGKRTTVVTPTSPLPPFEVPIIVEGNNELEIDGSMAGADAHGLTIGAGGSQISGVLIHSFSGDGIRITSGHGSSITASTLRNNAGNGVTVLSGNGNRVRQSAVYANGGLGIDLGGDGVTSNDVGDADTGANRLMNYPELSLVTAENGRVEGSVFVTAGGTTTVDLFANAAGCDPSGNGQGQSYVGSVDVSSIGGGSTSFSVDLPNPLAIGDVLTATATDRDGNTSEFSSCFVAVTTNVERTDAGVLPQTFELGQNYPNPFNPVTTIGFHVSTAEHVRIEVFDILGKRVAGLVDRFMDPGAYRVSFDAEDLPSGTYVYTMQAGTFRATKTLILLK